MLSSAAIKCYKIPQYAKLPMSVFLLTSSLSLSDNYQHCKTHYWFWACN